MIGYQIACLMYYVVITSIRAKANSGKRKREIIEIIIFMIQNTKMNNFIIIFLLF